MKTKFFMNAILVIITVAVIPMPSALCQVPQGFNYQAVARDGVTGNPISDPIDVKIAILSDDDPVTVLFEEIHYAVDPDEHGLFNIIVGKGTRIAGLASFNLIDWTVNPKYLRTKIIYGGEKDLGFAQLWSVPYAMVADSLGGPLKKLSVKGATTDLEEPLFEVKNNFGQTVFAVYNEGVRIYVDNGAKGSKGGFAVGGFGLDKDAVSDKYFFVSRDSIRLWLDYDPATKPVKGSFSVGSYDYTKGKIQSLLDVRTDSIRMYIDDPSKLPKGGFAVSGFSDTKAPVPQFLSVNTNQTNIQVTDPTKGFTVASVVSGVTYKFLDMNPINNFIGEESGYCVVPAGDNGKFNSFMGYQSGRNTVSGSKNVMIGYKAGMSCNSSFNILIGNEAGKLNSGDYNLFVGHNSGIANTGGNGNLFMGFNSGGANSSGYGNIFLGVNTGSSNSDGFYNVFVGNSSGGYNTSGDKNVCIGHNAGLNLGGDGNVMIGYEAGLNEPGGNRLYIDNSSTSSPLIWGDFENNRVVINGKASDNTLLRTLYVKGAVGASGGYFTESDLNLKRDIITISNALEKVKLLRGVNFYWKEETDRSPGMQMGFIAQEVKEIIPEVVSWSDENMQIQYAPVTALLVEAIKEQQSLIEKQLFLIEKMEREYDSLMRNQEELRSQIELIKNQLK